MTDGAPVNKLSPARLLTLAVVVIALVAVALIARPQPGPAAPAQTDGASAVLDDALASGTPTYVLIHSLT